MYEQASNARLNKAKLLTLQVGHLPFSTGLPQQQWDAPFHHLGIWFTQDRMDLEANQTRILTRIQETTARWAQRALSLQGKVILANTYLLSKLWYAAHICPFSAPFTCKVNQCIQKWAWAPAKVPLL